MKEELHTIMDQIKAAEDRRSELIEEVRERSRLSIRFLYCISVIALQY